MMESSHDQGRKLDRKPPFIPKERQKKSGGGRITGRLRWGHPQTLRDGEGTFSTSRPEKKCGTLLRSDKITDSKKKKSCCRSTELA